MNITDVIDLYTQLTALGIEVWLDGGWGVDALLGEQTRPHADVDIVVQRKDVPKLREFLESQGYADVPRDDTSPWNFVLGDPQGRLVDVHAVTLDAEGNGLYGPAEKGVMYPAGSLTGSGVINGHAIKCISAEYMVRFHTGYKLRETDFQDVSALCARFEIDYPKEAESKTLVLGLGNPILTDDGIGVHIAREVTARRPAGNGVAFAEASVGGLRLLDLIAGYDRVILVDAIQTRDGQPGDIHQLTAAGLWASRHAGSTHDLSFGGALTLGRSIGMSLPADKNIVIVAVEVEDVLTVGEGCTPAVAAAIPAAVEVVLSLL